MFLHVSVSHSIHRGMPAPRGGACLPEGVPAPVGSALGVGVCSGGVLPRGVWRPPVTATAAGGMYPTGIHSCFTIFSLSPCQGILLRFKQYTPLIFWYNFDCIVSLVGCVSNQTCQNNKIITNFTWHFYFN